MVKGEIKKKHENWCWFQPHQQLNSSNRITKWRPHITIHPNKYTSDAAEWNKTMPSKSMRSLRSPFDAFSLHSLEPSIWTVLKTVEGSRNQGLHLCVCVCVCVCVYYCTPFWFVPATSWLTSACNRLNVNTNKLKIW